MLGIDWASIWEQLRKIVEILVKRFFQVKDYVESLPTTADETTTGE